MQFHEYKTVRNEAARLGSEDARRLSGQAFREAAISKLVAEGGLSKGAGIGQVVGGLSKTLSCLW